MTETPTPTDEQLYDQIESLEQRVDELEEATTVGEDDEGNPITLGSLRRLGLTRRQTLLAGGYLLAGATLGQATLQALSGTAAATHGGGTIGTEADPLDAIHVEELYQQTDSLNATGSLNIPVRSSDPSSPSTGDIWLRDDL